MSLGRVQRDRAGLLRALERVDAEGWDSPTAGELLVQVRRSVVLPLVSSIGLHGVAYEQAVATGWAVAWEVLRAPSTRAATSPWGVLWVAVRRAILNEHMAAVFGTAPRAAWRLVADDRECARRPVSVEVLQESGWEPTTPARPAGRALVTLMVD